MKKKHKTYVVLPEAGPLCRRCKRPTEVRQHQFVTQKHLRQPFYYSRWYYCGNKSCPTNQIMPDEFRVFADRRELWESPPAPEPILGIGEPSDDDVPW